MLLDLALGPLLRLSLTVCPPFLTSPESSVSRAGSPTYQSSNLCPVRCSIAGVAPSNWSIYHNLDQLSACQQTLFLDFSVSDQVDDAVTPHRIRACTMWGTGRLTLPPLGTSGTELTATVVNDIYEVGWWGAGAGSDENSMANIVQLARQTLVYVTNGHRLTNGTTIAFGLHGSATVVVYVGAALLCQGMGEVAFKAFAETVVNNQTDISEGVAL